MQRRVDTIFYTPYKNRRVEKGMKVEVYRNLQTDNGYSIGCAKTKLVLAHCSTVTLKNATFVVSESGRQKTIQEKRKRVHAFIRGELVAYNEPLPDGFRKVAYNPYYTALFTDVESQTPIHQADEVFVQGKYAYAYTNSLIE